MLMQIDFTLSGIEYSMFYDSDKMTKEQALIECEFVGWGMGHDKSLFPHYLIVEKMKAPILKTIGNHCREEERNKLKGNKDDI